VAIFNESPSAVQTQIKLGKGLCKGASDILFLSKNWGLIGIEMKFPETKHFVAHLKDQCRFLLSISPHYGFFCDSRAMFEEIVLTGQGGIDPRRVATYLRQVKTGSIVWKRGLFLNQDLGI
jgi:hypothetical protein